MSIYLLCITYFVEMLEILNIFEQLWKFYNFFPQSTGIFIFLLLYFVLILLVSS